LHTRVLQTPSDLHHLPIRSDIFPGKISEAAILEVCKKFWCKFAASDYGRFTQFDRESSGHFGVQ
jgi:hypothetical protein